MTIRKTSLHAVSLSALALAASLAVNALPAAASQPAAANAAHAQPHAQPLKIDVYNPGEHAIFAVSSVLVEGRRDAILIDAQFSAAQARELV